MNKFIPSFVDITDWNKNLYSSTGGTRAKKIYVHPIEDIDYFFKGSKELDDRSIRYPLEFWSEIVSSKIGQWLGFNILDYNIGYDKHSHQTLGCLSKSMVDYSLNTLTEGIEYLRGFDPKYDPLNDENRYTLSFIKKSLNRFQLNIYENQFVEMLIFDALIGNSDRHQENWGFITLFKETLEELDNEIVLADGFWKTILPTLNRYLTKLAHNMRKIDEENKKGLKKSTLLNQSVLAKTVFSPIYDSGCCLGRELEDYKIEALLRDDKMLETYMKKGRSEVRWAVGNKPRHFDFLINLKNEHSDLMTGLKGKINQVYSSDALKEIVYNVDLNLPEALKDFKLPDLRKELMLKLVTLRINTFLEL